MDGERSELDGFERLQTEQPTDGLQQHRQQRQYHLHQHQQHQIKQTGIPGMECFKQLCFWLPANNQSIYPHPNLRRPGGTLDNEPILRSFCNDPPVAGSSSATDALA
ncbi:hypothetical protein PoB_000111100 [Plakobranchus ocellatus]|uniref:Uncharacterized protein n=1 Tax=Plakobranchus ocellatus TaxID=259542 RepID=A0AAV3XX04_9GAST|nr:hypothetical protein PoB_000111100 [Plakobranchus ocellatus]